MNNTILISDDLLRQFSMLADWQLKQMGIDPTSVTEAASLLSFFEGRPRPRYMPAS